jgi:DNA-directed RNA polymerase sigma subunit (sigma70/sigma32)
MANNELWLYKRQANQFNKQHVFIDDMTLMQQFDCADAEEAEEAKTGFSSIEAEAINYGLTVLTERERDILIECTRYQVDGKDLPDEVISELCERWDILKVNLRVIKHRAFKKLEKLAKSYT